MAGSRDYVGASYTGPRSGGQSAVRLVRYMEEREREEGGEERAATFGDREAFLEEAQERAEEGRRSSYAHLVVSPERGRELTDEDFGRVAEELARDRDGEQAPYYAAVHRDTEYAHLHVAVARDKYVGSELENLKEDARRVIEARERMREEPWRERVEEQEAQAQRREVRERESERERSGHRECVSKTQQQEMER